MENKNYKAHLALLGANLIYGANFLIAKGLMPNYFKPSGLVLLRVLAAGMLFWIVKQFIKEKIEKKDLILLAFCGLFGISINMLFFFHGLSLTSPIDASIIMTTTPVIVLILSAFILKERIDNVNIFGDDEQVPGLTDIKFKDNYLYVGISGAKVYIRRIETSTCVLETFAGSGNQTRGRSN